MKFHFYHQSNLSDCGPACLKMMAHHYGKIFKIENLRKLSGISKDGVNLLGIAEAAENIGFIAKGVKVTYETLFASENLPCIVYWKQNHFIIVIKKNKSGLISVADPSKGILKISEETFKEGWLSKPAGKEDLYGIALFLTPGPQFKQQKGETEAKTGWIVLLKYLLQYKRYVIQILLGLLIGSILQLFFPIITKLIVDNGIGQKNLNFITILIIAQFVLMFSRTIVDFLRSRILLYISTRINLTILSDFWIKMMRLPLSYYDTKMTGDIMQRIGDQKRIETFLTGATLNILFSLVSLFIFSILFLVYNWKIYFIFLMGTILYFFWIKFFLLRRRKLDFERFDVGAKENSATMQLIQGIQDIKLYNSENHFRWTWENIQVNSFKLTRKSLALSQFQETGAFIINEGKNIIITFIAASAVISNELSLGAMVAMQYILGQISAPVEQIVSFTQHAQDAGISFERLSEIYSLDNEEGDNADYIKDLSSGKSIQINNLAFTYPGAGNEPVLKNLSLSIAEGKVTAIVGMSGNGKTTLLKLLLKFYHDYKGTITIGESNTAFEKISPGFWRSRCGSVLQDSYIFNETIEKNIAIGQDKVDQDRIQEACRVANILEYILALPLGFQTLIGAEGNGISEGQKQRILIARAVYKDPDYIFFDEATNSLDANNETKILHSLQSFFKNKTVLIIAHRLSTVKRADKIVVLDKGEIVEEGNHHELIKLKGNYYELVKNQMELES